MDLQHLSHECIHPTPQSLRTAALELRFERSAAAILNISKDEAARRLRYKILFLQDEIDELQDRFWEEADRADDAWRKVDELEVQSNDIDAELNSKTLQLKLKTRELDTFKTELASLQSMSADSAQVLTDKLALARELAMLKPEIEDLRVQVSTHQNLHSEKLALQREVSALKVELENKDRRLSLVRAREGKRTETDSNDEAQSQSHIDELKKNLTEEKLARQRAEKQLSKIETDWKAQKAVFDDKLAQFRTKLRTNKENLKETETELQKALLVIATKSGATIPTGNDIPKARSTRKRGAAAIDLDTATGTPGHAGPTKRTKRAPSVVGEKSTFSITPFLKRTTNAAPESADGAHGQPLDLEDICSPTAALSKANSNRETNVRHSSVLALASPGKANLRVPRISEKPKAKLDLEPVNEEDSEMANNAVITTEVPEPEKRRKPTLKPTLKSKKPLVSFASFREGSAAPEQIKKRRVLGGAKTLFDDEDEDGGTGVGITHGQRQFGAFAGRGFGVSLLGGKAGFKKGPLVTAGDGFTFSPLKRDRKAAAAATKQSLVEAG